MRLYDKIAYNAKAICAAIVCIGFAFVLTVLKNRIILSLLDMTACVVSIWEFLHIIPIISVTVVIMTMLRSRKKRNRRKCEKVIRNSKSRKLLLLFAWTIAAINIACLLVPVVTLVGINHQGDVVKPIWRDDHQALLEYENISFCKISISRHYDLPLYDAEYSIYMDLRGDDGESFRFGVSDFQNLNAMLKYANGLRHREGVNWEIDGCEDVRKWTDQLDLTPEEHLLIRELFEDAFTSY